MDADDRSPYDDDDDGRGAPNEEDFDGDIPLDESSVDTDFMYPSDDPQYEDEEGSPMMMNSSSSSSSSSFRLTNRQPSDILQSYMGTITEKTHNHFTHPQDQNIFRMGTSPSSSSESHESVPTLELNKAKMAKRNLAKINGGDDDTSVSGRRIRQLVASSTAGSPHETKTVIVDTVGDIRRKTPKMNAKNDTTVITKPLIKNPDLFTIDMDIASAYEVDQVIAESTIQEMIRNSVRTKIMSVQEKDLSLRPSASDYEHEDSHTDVDPMTANINAWVKYTKSIKMTTTPSQTSLRDPSSSSSASSGGSTGKRSFQSSPLAVPNIEALPRWFIMNCLRAASESGSDLLCSMGKECESIRKWHEENNKLSFAYRNDIIRSSPGKKNTRLFPTKPFMLPALFKPSELNQIAIERKRGIPYQQILQSFPPRSCILCQRKMIQALADAQKASIDPEQWIPVQGHCNIFNVPGEYCNEFQLVPRGSAFCGITAPVMSYNSSHYVFGWYYKWAVVSEDGKETLSTCTTLIPEGNYTGTRPPEELIQSAYKRLHTDCVRVDEVCGWIEVEDIIYQPSKDDTYAKTVMPITDRYLLHVCSRHSLITRN